jgi:hypothetical protein
MGRRRLLIPMLFGFAALATAGCDDPSVTGENQLADAKVSANCPTQMFVGLPVTLNVKVTNTGSQSWPAAFVRLDNLDSFVINRIEDSSGRPGDDVGHDTHRFGSLAAGATETYSYAVTPKDAGNPELELQVWGDTLDAIPIPTNEDIAFYACENIAINP